jgi:nucleotide-binding universal stress UspA family protein
MRRILVATDFSGRSDRAVRRASLLARRHDAMLTIVHVIDDDQPHLRVEAERKSALALLDDMATSLREHDAVDCATRVTEGTVFEEIVHAADDVLADLIVIGAHRRRSLPDAFAGTTVDRVIRSSGRPTLMAHAAPVAPYAKLLLPVDLSDCSGEAIAVFKRLGLQDQAATSVLHVFAAGLVQGRTAAFMSHEQIEKYRADTEATAARELSNFLKRLDFRPDKLLLQPDEMAVAQLIDVTAIEIGADLIVIGTHGQSGFIRYLLGSVAREVLQMSNADVLVIPPAAARNH